MRDIISILHRKIGSNYPPFIVAEMSGNHNRSLDRALKIVDAAAEAKVDAIKLQTYTPETMTLDINKEEFIVSNSDSPWNGESMSELYKKAYTPWEWHKELFEHCKKHGLICFSTPFDSSAVEYLEELGVPAYKIASPENIDLPLIRCVAKTGKPVLISTGMATVAELDLAVRTAKENGAHEIALLKCTSSYPANPENANISTIPHMRSLFNLQIGISDHTMGIGVSVASVAYGATIIEKHFTLDRSEGGVDATFSMEPEEMRLLVEESKKAWLAKGQIQYGPSGSENSSLKGRRSLYIVNDMKQGDILTPENLHSIRPGLGLSPAYYDILIGKKINCAVSKGTPMCWDFIG